MDDEQTTPLRTPTAAEYETQIRDQIAAARKEIFERAQLEQTEGKARFMESMDTLKQTARMNAEREAEARAATVETRDELRRLNTVTADLATRQERTDRLLIVLGAATAVLAAATVGLTIALLIVALSG